jgi:hypothetical protein
MEGTLSLKPAIAMMTLLEGSTLQMPRDIDVSVLLEVSGRLMVKACTTLAKLVVLAKIGQGRLCPRGS